MLSPGQRRGQQTERGQGCLRSDRSKRRQATQTLGGEGAISLPPKLLFHRGFLETALLDLVFVYWQTGFHSRFSTVDLTLRSCPRLFFSGTSGLPAVPVVTFTPDLIVYLPYSPAVF
jgi:hypothetical protein